MKYNPQKHHRKSIRLSHYNYSQNGSYFIPLCTQDKLCLFGHIISSEMKLNSAGEMVYAAWDSLLNHYSNIKIDGFQIMPNHLHGIITLLENDPASSIKTISLSEIITRFKSLTTKKYIDGVRANNWQAFPGRLWQRNYYEHIIRNENSFYEISEYINSNPMNWHKDKLFR